MNMLINSKKNNSFADAKKTSVCFPCDNNIINMKHTTLLVCFFVIFLFNISIDILTILITQIVNFKKETLLAIL